MVSENLRVLCIAQGVLVPQSDYLSNVLSGIDELHWTLNLHHILSLKEFNYTKLMILHHILSLKEFNYNQLMILHPILSLKEFNYTQVMILHHNLILTPRDPYSSIQSLQVENVWKNKG